MQFKSLKIPIVQKVPIEDAEFGERGEITGGVPKNLNNAVYDDMFKKFAGCIGMNWQVYKVLAYHESRLNPSAKAEPTRNNPNASATGLFQVLKGYCEPVLAKVAWDQYCENPGRTNPALNTAIVTRGHFPLAINTVKEKCANASVDDQLHMLLFNNGSGPGALRKAIDNYGCDMKQWEAHPEIFKAASYSNGVKTVKLMRDMEVDSLFGPKDTAHCPFNTGEKPSNFPSS